MEIDDFRGDGMRGSLSRLPKSGTQRRLYVRVRCAKRNEVRDRIALVRPSVYHDRLLRSNFWAYGHHSILRIVFPAFPAQHGGAGEGHHDMGGYAMVSIRGGGYTVFAKF